MKKSLFSVIERQIYPARDRYNYLMNNPKELESILSNGAAEARKIAIPVLESVKKAIGIL